MDFYLTFYPSCRTLTSNSLCLQAINIANLLADNLLGILPLPEERRHPRKQRLLDKDGPIAIRFWRRSSAKLPSTPPRRGTRDTDTD